MLERRMHDQAGRFVDGHHVVVLVEDSERDILAAHDASRRRIPPAWPGRGTGAPPPPPHGPGGGAAPGAGPEPGPRGGGRPAPRRTGRSLTVTQPAAIHACTRVRVAAGTSLRCRRSTRSRRT